jgi:hypothetical protein
VAIEPIPEIKFELFIPGKNAKDIGQPGYGTDMRVIEQGVNLFLRAIIPEFNEAIAEINTILTVDIPKFEFGNVAVGSNPPANTQFIDYSTTASITTNVSGEAYIPLTQYSHGYSALVTPNWPGLMASVDLVHSTLTELWMNFQDTTGAYASETFTVTVRVVGA